MRPRLAVALLQVFRVELSPASDSASLRGLEPRVDSCRHCEVATLGPEDGFWCEQLTGNDRLLVAIVRFVALSWSQAWLGSARQNSGASVHPLVLSAILDIWVIRWSRAIGVPLATFLSKKIDF